MAAKAAKTLLLPLVEVAAEAPLVLVAQDNLEELIPREDYLEGPPRQMVLLAKVPEV